MSDDFTFDSSRSGAFAEIGNSVRFADMNKGITPIFFIESIPDEAKTEKAGTLKMIDQERVRLFTAGDVNSCPVHPVDAAIKERFADAYVKWKVTRTNDHIEGTPLDAWPLAPRGFVMELKALHIRSVEDLAQVADTNISRITEGRIWREKAIAWLATNKDAGAAARYAAKAERLEADNADLRRQIQELAAKVETITNSGDGAGRRGPGRPPKQHDAEAAA